MERACGLDVHKDSVFSCIINENGEIISKKFGVLTPDLEELRRHLVENHVDAAAMESTSIYWMPVWDALDGSAGKIMSTRTTHGNRFIRTTMVECAWAAARKRGTYSPKTQPTRTLSFDNPGSRTPVGGRAAEGHYLCGGGRPRVCKLTDNAERPVNAGLGQQPAEESSTYILKQGRLRVRAEPWTNTPAHN